MAKTFKAKQPNSGKADLARKAKQIEGIYKDYLGKLTDLQKQQNNLIAEFKRVLESKRLEETKKSLQ